MAYGSVKVDSIVTSTQTLTADNLVTTTGTQTLTNKTLTTPAIGTPASGTLSSCTVDGTDAVGFRNIPQNSQSAAYTLVLADNGKHIFHPVGDNIARTFTIPAKFCRLSHWYCHYIYQHGSSRSYDCDNN